jgi:2-phosphosulfolactate phosphatase
VRVDVAFVPAEARPADVAIVVDVMRATSTIAQALASGYERVVCCREIEEARAIRRELGEGILGGERDAVRVDGFDVGASPREFLEPIARTLILSTTNGTSAIVRAAETSGTVLVGSLLNLAAVAAAARGAGGDVAVVCAGYKGAFAIDDAYCAGRIVEELGGERGDSAKAAAIVARAFPDPLAGIEARTYGPPGLEEDIRFCARENVLDIAPRLAGMIGGAAEIRPGSP